MTRPTKGQTPQSDDGSPLRLSITPARASRYLQALAGGNYVTQAAQYAGVSRSTLRRWRHIAERERGLWDLQHPEQPIEELVFDWLDAHPPHVTDGERRVPYHRDSPALRDPPPIEMTPGYWALIVLDVLVQRADAEAEVQALARVQAAARHPQHWQAAMTFLERRHPDRWSRRDRTELTGPGGGPVAATVSTDELVTRIQQLLQRDES